MNSLNIRFTSPTMVVAKLSTARISREAAKNAKKTIFTFAPSREAKP
jgi:hypothetical protein